MRKAKKDIDTILEYFYANIEIDDECWVYKGNNISFDGKNIAGKRFIWVYTNGDINGKSKVVYNICGNIKCANPDHLIVGTIAEEKRYYHSIGIGGTRGKVFSSEIRENIRKGNKGLKRSHEFCMLMREKSKGNHSHTGHKLTEQQRKNISNGTRKAMARNDVHEYLSLAVSGEANHNWIDGQSCEYPKEFNVWFKKKIRARDHYRCQLCGAYDKDKHVSLSVHHINYVKDDTYCLNLISICSVCNIKVNKNRWYWQMYFSRLMLLNFWGGVYKHRYLSHENIDYINSKLGKQDRKPIVRSKYKKKNIGVKLLND
jgi:hypothetical protein